jgi:K+-transporting ATPase A subunit
MSANGVWQLVVYVVVLIALTKPLGAYMARVYEGRPCGVDRMLGWLERLTYRVCGVRAAEEQGWKGYAVTMMLFNLVGLLAVYLLQRLQGGLPLNPMGVGAVSADSSFNTAVSFATNTNWQGYGGETTMSYLTQMLGLTVQNFVSAAAGMAASPGARRRRLATSGSISRGRRCTFCCRYRSCSPWPSCRREWCRRWGQTRRRPCCSRSSSTSSSPTTTASLCSTTRASRGRRGPR